MTKPRLIALIFLGFSVYAFGQFGPFGGRPRGGSRLLNDGGTTGGQCLVPGYFGSGEEDSPAPRKIDRSGFVYARLRYHVQPWWRQEGNREVPWHHDYPDGDMMFPASLERLTRVHTTPDAYQLVDIESKDLYQYPFIYISEPGFLNLLPGDVKALREYVDRGGFILMDDFRGNEFDNSQWENMKAQMTKLFPDRELKLVPPSHAIFHSFFEVEPQKLLPPYRMSNSGDPQYFGIFDQKGNILVMVDFNNDISEYWQALDVGQCSIHEAGTAVELGVNYALYALTH
jgi:hypothetical protein